MIGSIYEFLIGNRGMVGTHCQSLVAET
jgi:hypothetical protein